MDAKAVAVIDDLLKILREVEEYLSYSNYATDSGSLADDVRAAIAKAESKIRP